MDSPAVWECRSEDQVVHYLCEYVLSSQKVAMEWYRAQWSANLCDVITRDGWFYPWPCYYSMWRFFWEQKAEVATWCWQHNQMTVCTITCFAAVLWMLKQARLWQDAHALWQVGESIGVLAMTNWPSIVQTPWFVPMDTASKMDRYVPGGSGRFDEPVSPYSLDGGPKEDGFFDVHTAPPLRPIAEALKENWPAIRAEIDARRGFRPFKEAHQAYKEGLWTRYVPGQHGAQQWWDSGRAGMGAPVRLWGDPVSHYNDTWWDDRACDTFSPTLCRVLKPVLPTTERPVPQYALDTATRWEFMSIYTLYPGAMQALHADPTRCFWQVCVEGCDTATVQVGKEIRNYVEGEMIAFDATFDHSVAQSAHTRITRVIIHASMHYCNGHFVQ